MAGELTTCKSQCVRLRGALAERTERGGVSQTPLSPPPGRVPPRSDRLFTRLEHVDRRPSGRTGREGLGKARRPRPTPTSPSRVPQPDASPTPYHSAIPVFNTEEKTIHCDRSRNPQAPEAPSPSSALLVQERQSSRGAGGHAETAVGAPPPTHRTLHLSQFRPRPLKAPRGARREAREPPHWREISCLSLPQGLRRNFHSDFSQRPFTEPLSSNPGIWRCRCKLFVSPFPVNLGYGAAIFTSSQRFPPKLATT